MRPRFFGATVTHSCARSFRTQREQGLSGTQQTEKCWETEAHRWASQRILSARQIVQAGALPDEASELVESTAVAEPSASAIDKCAKRQAAARPSRTQRPHGNRPEHFSLLCLHGVQGTELTRTRGFARGRAREFGSCDFSAAAADILSVVQCRQGVAVDRFPNRLSLAKKTLKCVNTLQHVKTIP